LWLLPICGLASLSVALACAGSPFPATVRGDLMGISFLAIFAHMGAMKHEKTRRATWLAEGRVEIKQQELDTQHAAVSRMLTRLCDSLVQLGPSFTILEPNPRLAALLFNQDPGSMQGDDFCNVIATEQERKRFVEALTSGTHEEESVAYEDVMLHISLNDIYGGQLHVQAHHTCFRDSDGQPHYLVGLVESGAQGDRGGPPCQDMFPPPPLEHEDINSDISSSNASAEDSHNSYKQMVVGVKLCRTMTMVNADDAFIANCGDWEEMQSIISYFQDGDVMSAWFARLARDIFEGKVALPTHRSYGKVRLRTKRPTVWRRVFLKVVCPQANASVDFPDMNSLLLAEKYVVHLHIDPKVRRGERNARRSTISSGTPSEVDRHDFHRRRTTISM